MAKHKQIETGTTEKFEHNLSELLPLDFNDIYLNLFKDYLNDSIFNDEKLSLPKEIKSEINSVTQDLDFYQDYITSLSENELNQRRQEILTNKITDKFINTILEEDFEFGVKSQSELIIREQLSINELATRNWLNEIFIENFNNEIILIGLLRIIGRFDEEIIFPQGKTMALAALSHKNDEVKELGVRAFENWNSLNSLEVLKNISFDSNWLQDYLNQVIKDLKSELCLS